MENILFYIAAIIFLIGLTLIVSCTCILPLCMAYKLFIDANFTIWSIVKSIGSWLLTAMLSGFITCTGWIMMVFTNMWFHERDNN